MREPSNSNDFKKYFKILNESLPNSGPLHSGSENQFPSNFAHETISAQW